MNLAEYNNFEVGEGKTALDTHFAHISHKIVGYVRVENDLETGEELGQIIQVNYVYYLYAVKKFPCRLFIWIFCFCSE